MRRDDEANSRWSVWARLGAAVAMTTAGRGSEGDFLGERWTAEDGKGIAGERGDDLRHAQEGNIFNALGGRDNDLVAGEDGRDVGDGFAEVRRWGDAEDDFRFEDGSGEVRGDVDAGGNGEAGEIEKILAGVVEGFGEGGGVGPETDLVAAAAGEGDGESGAVSPGTKDGDAAHAGTLRRAEAAFGSGDEAADVGVVLDDDEQRDEEHAANGQRGADGIKVEKKWRVGGGAKDGAERDEAGEGDDDQKDGEDAEGGASLRRA